MTESLKNAKKRLREYILNNKDQVKEDLKKMREMSDNGDIYEYMKKSFGEESISEIVDLTFDERIELWCKLHNKSIHWGKNITEGQLNEFGCPTQRVRMDLYI